MTSHTKTLSIETAARILREHFNLPSNTNVDFIVESIYLDPSDWRGEYGPDHVCRQVTLTWSDDD